MTEHLTSGVWADRELATGWEPDLPAADSLLRRFVLATADHTCLLAERVGGRTRRWDDLAVADPGSPVFLDNAAVLLAPPAYGDLRDVLARVEEFYPPERHVSLLSAWPLPPVASVAGTAWELMGHPPVMFRPAGGSAPPPPSGLQLVPVTDAAGLRAFVTTLMAAFGMPPAENMVLADERVLGEPLLFFLGLLDGEPVATAGARLGHGLVDVEWVSALPSVRGRGIGSAVSWAATLADPGLPAVLIASDDGQPVYERMGYLRLLRATMWHRPAVA